MFIIFKILKAIFGLFFVLFLPGFIISFIFFPLNNIDKKNKKITWLERIFISFIISIIIVPLFVFYFNLFSIKINEINIYLIILIICILSLIILLKKGNI